MTSRNLSLLGLIAIVVLAAGLWLANPRSSAQKSDLLYPGLKQDLDKITAIRLYKAGNEPAVELTRGESHWQVAQRSSYPADAAKVRRLLQSLADARSIEEKTSNPDNYPALGVEDVADAAAAGTRVELVGTAQPVDLIVGKNAGTKGSYVRRTGEPASWQTNESIEASATPHDWLQTAVLDIGADRVQSAAITVGSGKPYTIAKAARADADFKVAGLPKGKEADTFAANNMATALAGLTLSDVRPAQDFAADKSVAHATFRTFDGLVVELDGFSKDDKHYVAAKTSYDDALAKQFHVETQAPADGEGNAPKASSEEESGKTNARLQGWVYEIADYKYELIFKPADSLVKK
ncbi:MAG TPA: DUF4340 domain-containing protein [Povalibacter sp.]|uniref:DUF4340 domain-containing protein n=1 Tax=Povalibacter sp. TaxID=1962978 RepID=UPI002B64D23F|nr:DUF4340 domain-containing protein [Povalibacter sp.]HMN43443.1 DUF4340 domain-containing protein [Povalibacter sp.]